MSKMPRRFMNYIDLPMAHAAKKVAPSFRKLNFTANGITYGSILFGLNSAFSLYRGDLLGCVLSYLLSVFLDDLDGIYARMYRQTSKYGDLLDHYSDWVVHGALTTIVLIRHFRTIRWPIVLLFLLVFLSTTIYAGACEKYNGADNESLGFLRNLFPTKRSSEKWLTITRPVGYWGFYIVFIGIIAYLELKPPIHK